MQRTFPFALIPFPFKGIRDRVLHCPPRLWVLFLFLLPLLAACGPRQSDTLRRLVILYTNDEHGWMEAGAPYGGAPGLLAQWRGREGYRPEEAASPESPFIVLSGGDSWTGPAISTLLHGESMVDVMNALGYRAAAIGNHDFDYGLDNLQTRAAQAQFPLLAANLRQRSNGEIPAFARPYVLLEVNHVKIGVLGLTTLEAPYDTQPEFFADLEVIPYADALEEYAPQARAEGAELLVVASHLCNGELQQLAATAAELGISVFGGGHCHEELAEGQDGVLLMQSGYFLHGYARVEFYFDKSTRQITGSSVEVRPNPAGKADQGMAARVESWRTHLEAEVFAPIGYTKDGIKRTSPDMAALLTQGWLAAVPEADLVFASSRYVQQSIPAGDITPATVVGVLPTENTLFLMHLSGEQVLATLQANRPIVGGLNEKDGQYFLGNGAPLDPQATYAVLIPKALYHGGNGYNVKALDPQARDTGIDWRQAVIDALRSLGSSQEHPLETMLP